MLKRLILTLVACFSLGGAVPALANPDGIVVRTGDLRISESGAGPVSPDGSVQNKATAQGAAGPQGPIGFTGAPGPAGAQWAATTGASLFAVMRRISCPGQYSCSCPTGYMVLSPLSITCDNDAPGARLADLTAIKESGLDPGEAIPTTWRVLCVGSTYGGYINFAPGNFVINCIPQ